jgi:hypothetical protein
MEKASVREQRIDAETRKFMFTITELTKTLPDSGACPCFDAVYANCSTGRTILKDINLAFYPGMRGFEHCRATLCITVITRTVVYI